MTNKIFALGAALAILVAGAWAQDSITAVAPIQIHFSVPSAPYLLAVGTDGLVHPVSLPAGVTLATQTGGSISISVPGSMLVRNEIPLPGTVAQTWTLLRAPTPVGATCWRNGVHQSPGLDYTLAGNTITSVNWLAGDTLACDYQ